MITSPLIEYWQWEQTKERFGTQLGSWDKKLSKMDDELLYYVYMRAESILAHREEKAGNNE